MLVQVPNGKEFYLPMKQIIEWSSFAVLVHQRWLFLYYFIWYYFKQLPYLPYNNHNIISSVGILTRSTTDNTVNDSIFRSPEGFVCFRISKQLKSSVGAKPCILYSKSIWALRSIFRKNWYLSLPEWRQLYFWYHDRQK